MSWGEERGGGRNRNTFLFSVLRLQYSNFPAFTSILRFRSEANTLRETAREGIFKQRANTARCPPLPAPAVPFPAFPSPLTLPYSAHFPARALELQIVSAVPPSLPTSLALPLSLSVSPKQGLEIELAGRQQRASEPASDRASGREQENRRGQGDKKGRERC